MSTSIASLASSLPPSLNHSHPPFTRIVIIGPGLLGGSIALAIRQCLPEVSCRIWARREAVLEAARCKGITETYSDLQEAVEGADLIILSTPIDYFCDLTERMLPALSEGCLVTDIGSVKASVHEGVGALLAQHGRSFIGSHPMAGSEKQGLEYASAELLADKVVALTNDQHCEESDLNALATFWTLIGMRPYRISAAEHDSCVARISHVPHILAALCARAADRADDTLAKQHLQSLAATGFRDTSRVSLGAIDMWESILLENTHSIIPTLQYCVEDLQRLIAALEQRDGVDQWLAEGKSAREFIMPTDQ